MDRKELNTALINHIHWLLEDIDGWELMRADLRDADLRDANLRDANLDGANLDGANLDGANLIGANLIGANLRDANLDGADLRGANLRYADLRDADLRGANLRDADLRGANLDGANLIGANLTGANLYGADLIGAILIGANLRDANLDGANLIGANLIGAKNIPFIPLACPDTGSFIGYKKARGYIIELEILADARRSSATSRKCRCDKARVLSIQTLEGELRNELFVPSDYDNTFIYKVGEIVEEPNFCEDRWNECAPGIHFFINRQEAVEY